MRTDYEQLAQRYDEDRARWSFPRDEIVDELLASRAAVRVLDLGCGTGRWAASQPELLANPRVTVFGADPSAAMLAEASNKDLGSFIRAGAENLPLRSGTIDFLTSSYAFHHFTDKERALDEIARVLIDDGAFRINNIAPEAAAGWWLYEFFPEAIANDAARFWPVARLTAALDARGFSVETTLDAGSDEIPPSQALEDVERRVVSQLALLDDDAYDRGLARLREALRDPDAQLTTTRSRLCLTARRWR
jgi:ubiquinone/menaquinone biosynthesis C-methylase UbiE